MALSYAESAGTAQSVRERAKVRKTCTDAYVEGMTELVKHIK